ncbi:IclR family transcriptional regulator [Burkholderia lata]|uniref:Transcriptional regulator, IclR family n=1 Tax=Burkholderia lata (strain ATCC 17760 / DSM 23089 / LMG 22485 / NCIMB 9086 / R18194 / 383) TaxID=482957 RepID=Q397N2_BURL3|nr:IclR family transcriptional regulator [Burkholderia lata]ABB11329.1 transcriptional regulator, IclR family [Burkholderia lata]
MTNPSNHAETATPEPAQVTLTLDRGLQLLRAFHAERAPLTNGELAQRTGMSRSAVSRLTSTLIQLGYIRRVAGGTRFELATGVFGIGHAYLETNPVTRLAQPLMQQLADRLDVSVALATADGLDMLYIAHRTSSGIATLRLGVGSLLPMGLTAIGRAWLWGLPDPQRQEYVARLLEAAGAQRDAMRAGIDHAFEDLRENGVCLSYGEFQRNAYGIALPVRVGDTATPMSLSCGAIKAHADIDTIRQRIVPALKQAARDLEHVLRDVRYEP